MKTSNFIRLATTFRAGAIRTCAMLAWCAYVLVALALPALARADDYGCDFAPPSPLLKKHAYPAQSFAFMSDYSAVETASLGNGVMLTIVYEQCVDTASRDFLLTAPSDPDKQGFIAWTDFARDVLSRLEVEDARGLSSTIEFLAKARAVEPKDGVVAKCVKGEIQGGEIQDDCDWDSGGMFSVHVRPGEETTQVSVHDSVSG